MSRRHEFSQSTKREALKRSGGRCEANDPVYGMEPGTRCYADLAKGKQFDHWPLPAGDEGSDTLENCMVVCLDCHGWKTTHYDVPMLAKGKRIFDKHNGIERKSSRPMVGSKASGLRKKMNGDVERR